LPIFLTGYTPVLKALLLLKLAKQPSELLEISEPSPCLGQWTTYISGYQPVFFPNAPAKTSDTVRSEPAILPENA
jgi:hypothetical protein